MAMERSRRVAEIWNWLPAFRVVAEYQSIHRASAVLHVGASALSRTIRLLEDAVGEALFLRTPAGLTLTSYGATLLEGTRDAQRRVDDALAAGPAAHGRGAVLVAGASGAVLPQLLARTVATLVGEARFTLLDVDDTMIFEELVRGELDVALVPAVAPDVPRELVAERLGEIVLAVHSCDGARPGDVVAPSGIEDAGEGRVVATAPTLDAVARIALGAGASAVLPASPPVPGFRVVARLADPVAVFAVRRRPLGADNGVARAVVEAARGLLAEPPP